MKIRQVPTFENTCNKCKHLDVKQYYSIISIAFILKYQ